MLLKLSIKNYILIHDLEIDFNEGFSVITGETGAGKSILLGALSMILGQRADSGILLDKSRKCIIEGLFMINGYNLEGFFNDHELDFENSIILRREINQNGKSRAFINDTPVNLIMLKDLGDRLVNVHSQNSIITLNDSDFQLAVIDSYAGIQAEVSAYRTGFYKLIDLKRQLAVIEENEARASGEKDYFQFLLDELNVAQLKPGELPELEEQLDLLTHAEEIKSSLFQINQIISGSDVNILAQLAEAGHTLNSVAKYKPEIKILADRLNINYIDIKDLSNELNNIEEKVFIDPPLIELLTQRIDYLYRLMKKHQVSTIEELLLIKQDIELRVSDEAGMEEQIKILRAEITKLETSLLEMAGLLSSKRQMVVSDFEKEVTDTMNKLGMTVARFTIELLQSGSISKDGIDKVKFLFSANRGIELKELSNTASGGELSRLMLSIKSMISQKNLLPTIIFDEIDNGVSGEVAGKVGNILKRMGRNMQVVAITHLPQIAGKGDNHYWVYKSENEQTTATFIKQLSASERVEEIAKMLSNETVTVSAINTANELLNN
ncbi:MAG: DNA repair protein RecN [Bacteroidales bacterium]|nr:DNA repair protein RecN [Bacteroidales bacterium]